MIPRERSKENASAIAGAFSSARGPAGPVMRELEEIESSGGDGIVHFGRAKALHVSSLDKSYFPAAGWTKGDVMRYYAAVSPVLLPVIKDRPLILKRYPNGIDGESFFQQNAGKNLPDAVRTGRVKTESGQRAVRIIGGDLATLLYTVQIGTIAVHAWQSRLQAPTHADMATIDLDPGDDVAFAEVVALAKGIKAELDKLHLLAAIKTSGSSGLHIVLPLPPKTTFDVAARITELIATRTAERYPRRATVERTIRARPAGTIYVDAQQNAEGKSVVTAYSLRERPQATVSAPLDWRELRRTLRLEMFTIESMPARLQEIGDLWSAAMKRRNSKRVLDRALRES